MITVAQTLSDDWVITVKNPEEDGWEWETELARFHASSTAPNTIARLALELAVAETAVRLNYAVDFEKSPICVTSHDADEKERMVGRIAKAKAQRDW